MVPFNASLNATARVLLGTRYVFIRRRIAAHRTCMLRPSPRRPSSSSSPTCINHAQVRSVPFHGAARLRPIYFGPLVPHLVLAALVVPLAPTTSIGRGIDPVDALAQPVVVATASRWRPCASGQLSGMRLSGIGGSPRAERRTAQCMASTPPIRAKSVRSSAVLSFATNFVSAIAALRSREAAYRNTSASVASRGGG